MHYPENYSIQTIIIHTIFSNYITWEKMNQLINKVSPNPFFFIKNSITMK